MRNLNNTLENIGHYSASNPLKIFTGTLILLILAGLGASQIQMEMGMDLYVDENSQTMNDWNEIREDFDKGNVMFVMLETEEQDLYAPENSEMISDLYQEYYSELKYGDIEAVSLVTSFSHPIKAGPGAGEIPETEEEILNSMNFSFNQHRSNMGIIANLHPEIQESQEYQNVTEQLENEAYPVEANGSKLFTNGNTAMFMIQYGNVEIPEDRKDRLGGLLPITEDEIIEEQVKEITESAELPANSNVTYTGTPVFEEAAFGLMLPEMIKLFGLAFGVILVTVIILMRGRLDAQRNIMLPLGTSLTAVMIMVGAMGLLGFNFNAIMLGVLPIALGLSIDYSLQIHSRYLEERENGVSKIDAAEKSTKHVGKALLIAMTTTAIGLGALLISSVPPTRQFGATAIIAIAGSMILSISLLPALMTKFDKQSKKSASGLDLEAGVSKFFDKLSPHNNLVLIAGLLAIIGGGFAAPQVSTTTDMLDYWPDIQERDDIRELEQRIPAPNINYIIVESEDAYTLENFEELQSFQHQIESHKNVVTVMSPIRGMEVGNTQPPVEGPDSDTLPDEDEFTDALEHRANTDRPPQLGLTPEDHPNRVVIQVFVEDIEGETEREVIDFISDTADENLENHDTRVTGEMVLNRNVIENVTSGLAPMTALSFLLGFGFLSVQ